MLPANSKGEKGETRIIKIDLSTFKTIYAKCFEGKYIQNMYIYLKRRIENQEKIQQQQIPPTMSGKNCSHWYKVDNQ